MRIAIYGNAGGPAMADVLSGREPRPADYNPAQGTWLDWARRTWAVRQIAAGYRLDAGSAELVSEPGGADHADLRAAAGAGAGVLRIGRTIIAVGEDGTRAAFTLRRGRPSLTAPTTHSPRISVRLPEELADWLAGEAAAAGKTRSALIQDWLEARRRQDGGAAGGEAGEP